jgi:hypothetical protein
MKKTHVPTGERSTDIRLRHFLAKVHAEFERALAL